MKAQRNVNVERHPITHFVLHISVVLLLACHSSCSTAFSGWQQINLVVCVCVESRRQGSDLRGKHNPIDNLIQIYIQQPKKKKNQMKIIEATVNKQKRTISGETMTLESDYFFLCLAESGYAFFLRIITRLTLQCSHKTQFKSVSDSLYFCM